MLTEPDNDESVKVYFADCDVYSCAKCIEAKKLGNKYYNQLSNISDKIANHVLEPMTDVNSYFRKLDGLFTKFEKNQKEFIGVLNGRTKCCCPMWMLEDYLKAWCKNE